VYIVVFDKDLRALMKALKVVSRPLGDGFVNKRRKADRDKPQISQPSYTTPAPVIPGVPPA
jgi:hypothetical protein